MQRLFLLALAFILTLGAALGVYLFVSLVPFFHPIGLAAAGLVILGIGCTAALMVAFTYSKIGIWAARRRTIVHGEVVVFRNPDGSFVHLSGMHEQMKIPPPAQVSITEEPMADEKTIIELWQKGMSLRDIVRVTGRKYHEIQRITSEQKGG